MNFGDIIASKECSVDEEEKELKLKSHNSFISLTLDQLILPV